MNHLTQPAFSEPRKEGDPDLVAEITSLLTNFRDPKTGATHPNPSAWASHPSLVEAALPANPKFQRFLINRYWRVRLSELSLNIPEKSTSAERYCLEDGDAQHVEWVQVFGQWVVPTIVKYQL